MALFHMFLLVALPYPVCAASVVRMQKQQPSKSRVWLAGSYGNCALCSTGSVMVRPVTCHSLDSGVKVDSSECNQNTRPETTKTCICGERLCELQPTPQQCQPLPTSKARAARARRSAQEPAFEEVGCFGKLDARAQDVKDRATYDMSCLNATRMVAPCRNGLPFFYLQAASMKPGECFQFCIGKSMDLFGVEDGKTCRCGASFLNTQVWHGAEPIAQLVFDKSLFAPAKVNSLMCPLKVYRYVGPLKEGSIPRDLNITLSVSDVIYIDSIVKQRRLSFTDEVDGLQGAAAIRASARARGRAARAGNAPSAGDRPAWETRSCFPQNCGSGEALWPTRTPTAPPGVEDKFHEYVVIPYMFEPTVDDTRKTALREAVKKWHAKTCIVFQEASSPAAPYVLVRKQVNGSCSTGGVGNVGGRQATLTMGWCDSTMHVGSLMHELGHSLGMDHTQNRPDAQKAYFGKGPFLQMLWQNVGADWVPQFTAADTDYIGSTEVGYAPYDFGSIMHYDSGSGDTQWFDTIPPEQGVLTRKLAAFEILSKGDIDQVTNVYQCKPKNCPTCVSLAPDCTDSKSAIFIMKGSPATCTALLPLCDKDVVQHYCPTMCASCGKEPKGGVGNDGGTGGGTAPENGGTGGTGGEYKEKLDKANEEIQRLKKIIEDMQQQRQPIGDTKGGRGGGGGASTTPRPSSSCKDSTSPPFHTPEGKPFSCVDLKNMCTNPDMGKLVKENCPATCGTCPGRARRKQAARRSRASPRQQKKGRARRGQALSSGTQPTTGKGIQPPSQP